MKHMTKNTTKLRSGFAVSGILLNVALGGAFLVGAGSFGISGAHKLGAMASFPTLNNENQKATTLIANDLRSACTVQRASAEQIVLARRAPGQIVTVSYTYHPKSGTLTREEGQTTQTVLADLDTFSFTLFQRPGAKAGFDHLDIATAANAGLVGCHWTNSSKVGGAKLDSEQIEMAPIAMRNQR